MMRANVLVFLVVFLAPLVPAVVIFKKIQSPGGGMFSGAIWGFTFKFGGAIGAYMALVVLALIVWGRITPSPRPDVEFKLAIVGAPEDVSRFMASDAGKTRVTLRHVDHVITLEKPDVDSLNAVLSFKTTVDDDALGQKFNVEIRPEVLSAVPQTLILKRDNAGRVPLNARVAYAGHPLLCKLSGTENDWVVSLHVLVVRFASSGQPATIRQSMKHLLVLNNEGSADMAIARFTDDRLPKGSLEIKVDLRAVETRVHLAKAIGLADKEALRAQDSGEITKSLDDLTEGYRRLGTTRGQQHAVRSADGTWIEKLPSSKAIKLVASNTTLRIEDLEPIRGGQSLIIVQEFDLQYGAEKIRPQTLDWIGHLAQYRTCRSYMIAVTNLPEHEFDVSQLRKTIRFKDGRIEGEDARFWWKAAPRFALLEASLVEKDTKMRIEWTWQ